MKSKALSVSANAGDGRKPGPDVPSSWAFPQLPLSRELKQWRSMKRILVLMLGWIAFAAGCNSAKNITGPNPGTPMQGTWDVTGSIQCTPSCGSPTGTYQVTFTSSPCSVSTPVGTFSVQGPVCFIANNNTGEGSISGKGLPSSSKNNGQGVLIGVPSNPVPDNATANLLFVSAYGGGNFVEFTGSGTVAGGKITGTGSCSASTPVCQGASATFSATLQ